MELVDRQVFFAIETLETAAEIPCEKMIAIKTEIMDNWDEYWRVSEQLIEEGERLNADPALPRPAINMFCLVDKSRINEEEEVQNVQNGWTEIIRFV